MGKDISQFSIDDLKTYIKELEAQIKQDKKYGLVWDKENTPEQVVLDCKVRIPTLIEDKERTIISGAGNNLIIEGDNFHSLASLSFVKEESIDVIYIDPPYNTGNQDFIYNDKFINKDDGYKHSKWLSFMEKRLILCKHLLKDTGVIFISIDDHENAQLKLLCDKIFGEHNFESFIWKKKGGAGNTERIIGCLTEYIHCYFKKKTPGIFNFRKIERQYKYKDEKGPYNLEGLEKTNSGTYYRPTMLFAISDPNTGIEFFPSKGNRWTIGKEGLKEALKKNKIFFDYKKNKVYIIKRPEDYEESENVFYNLLTDVGSLSTAKKEIELLLGEKELFDTPKPVTLIKELLHISSKRDSVILDFFAGSGTTGQAVLELNKEDGGNRRFILCTNNENGICENVTYPRLKTVITGIRPDGTKYSEGIAANLRYFKTDFVKDQANRDSAKYALVEKCNGLLCILEDCFDLKENKDAWFKYESSDKCMYIFNDYYDKSKFDEMKESIKSCGKKVVLYVYSTDETVDSMLIEDLKNVEMKPIPTKIYEIYKEIVESIKRG